MPRREPPDLGIATSPPWGPPTSVASGTRLERDQMVDLCVVGAGIAGVTTAYLAVAAGCDVTLLEASGIAAGQTQFSSAHLATALDDRYAELERVVGVEGTRLVAASHAAAIDCIENITARERIACEFSRTDGYLFRAPDTADSVLEHELEAAHNAGLRGVEWAERAPFPSFDSGRCLRFPDQAQFDPLRYVTGMARGVRRLGGRIFAGEAVERIEGGAPARVVTRGGREVRARAVVVATNSPIDSVVTLHTKQAPYTTYVIGLAVVRGTIPASLYWDTADPYHYVRLYEPREKRGRALVLVGGEDHKTGQADDGAERFARLEAWAREHLPEAGAVVCRWSGQVMETLDGLAFIGRHPAHAEGVYVVSGDSGMGLTHGTVAGLLLNDLIAGRENPWSGIYDPARLPISAAGTMLRENVNVAVQYARWLTRGDVSSPDDIAPGAGAILRRGLSPVAVHRDLAGHLHERSAVCPHLGCIVAWNGVESTWDCPCHGSRFDVDGRVVNGPASSDLAPA